MSPAADYWNSPLQAQWRSYGAEGPCAEACDGPPSNKTLKKLFICLIGTL